MADQAVRKEKRAEGDASGEFSIQATASKWAPAFRALILLCISVVATLVRVFSVPLFTPL